MATFELARAVLAGKARRGMPGSKKDKLQQRLRQALEGGRSGALSEDQSLRFMHLAIDVAEDLDELERRIDPHGPPPRHAAMAYQRLRRLKGPRRGKS